MRSKEFLILGCKDCCEVSHSPEPLLASGQLNPAPHAQRESTGFMFSQISIICLVRDVGGLCLSWHCVIMFKGCRIPAGPLCSALGCCSEFKVKLREMRDVTPCPQGHSTA